MNEYESRELVISSPALDPGQAGVGNSDNFTALASTRYVKIRRVCCIYDPSSMLTSAPAAQTELLKSNSPTAEPTILAGTGWFTVTGGGSYFIQAAFINSAAGASADGDAKCMYEVIEQQAKPKNS